jgi:hypothetical protein
MKTNEIVKRAQQIADLENSSFISWAENVNLLNEAYRDIFQKAINANVKYWLKDWVLKDGESIGENATRYKLPSDFYTLYSINEKGTNRNLFKKSTNETTDGFKYDIENGYLIVYGAMRKDVIAKYYKAPKKLYYKGEEIETGATLGSGVYTDCADNLIVQYNATTGAVNIYDIKTETQSNVTVDVLTPEFVIACKQGLCIGVLVDNAITTKFYSYKDGSLIFSSSQDDLYFFLDEKKRLLFYSDGVLVDVGNGSFDMMINLPINFDGNLNYFGYIDTEQKIAKWGNTSGTVSEYNFLNKEKNDYVQPYGLSHFGIYDKWVITRNANNNLRCLPIVYDISEVTPGGVIAIGINKKDYKTSYGYVDDNGVLQSIFDDMELDTPNSFFDAMLAYSLALQYKAKQNAINEGLVTLYQNAENQFFNSIPQDTFSNSRIQNVY